MEKGICVDGDRYHVGAELLVGCRVRSPDEMRTKDSWPRGKEQVKLKPGNYRVKQAKQAKVRSEVYKAEGEKKLSTYSDQVRSPDGSDVCPFWCQ